MKRLILTHFKRCGVLLLCLVITLGVIPASAYAQGESKTVRIGWFDSSFYNRDESGRRSGYAYEYQMKIAAYTGWNYEYITGSWPVLFQMLSEGGIDMLADVSHTPEREEKMLFPSLPMGTEEYYLFTAPGNSLITPVDLTTLNGKKIGVNKASLQADLLDVWTKEHDILPVKEELECSEEQSLAMLEAGELDAYVTVDSFVNPERTVPVTKIGSSDYYFAINKERRDLLDELNLALDHIQEENRYYNEQLFSKYFKRTGVNAYLSREESSWLEKHGKIRVGYEDDYLAYCARDKQTGELTGVLSDILAYASACLANADMEFEAKAYPNISASIEALKAGEVDCIFPANLSSYYGESNGLAMTSPVLGTDVYAVVRESDLGIFSQKEHVVAAVSENDVNYEEVLRDNFPNWVKVYYSGTEECLKAVASGVADCILISNYRYNNIARTCNKYDLAPVTTGVGVDYSFAMLAYEKELYAILSRVVGLIPVSTVNAALSYYYTEDARMTLLDYVSDNISAVMLITGIILVIFIVMMIRSMRAERKARELITATETDELTGLYTRKYFFRYADSMYRDKPDRPMDAIALDMEQFHSVNALNGRAFGDSLLKALGEEAGALAKEMNGIAGRFEGDRFDIYISHTDDYRKIFERLQKTLDDAAPAFNIRLRMGVMPWQEALAPEQMFEMARTACGMARGRSEDHLVIFNEDVRNRENYEQSLISDLRRAVDSYEFEVYYQPVYDIQSDKPKLISAEALVRWRHPELGVIYPGDFIPLFEKNGQISIIDNFVWSEVAKRVAGWRDEFGIRIPVSVNLSKVDVYDPALEKNLEDILRFYRLDHSAIRLEVAESSYAAVHAGHLIQVVKNLRKNDFVVGMDDFGSGYPSMSLMSDMQVDVIKIDRGFIKGIESDDKNTRLVELVIEVAKRMNISVVAEGVETEAQMSVLRAIGCPAVQGFYFSRPLSASDFEELLLARSGDGSLISHTVTEA